MRLTSLYSSILFIFLSVFGCKSFDKVEPVPAYIYIEKIDLSVKSDGSQGSNAHDIKDGWVFANGTLIGVFELPCMVPILKKDSTVITVFAGIKVNGSSNNRKFYPFYEVYTKTVFLKPAKIDSLKPVVTYKEGITFSWVEDFEDLAVSLEKTGVTRTVDSLMITSLPDEVFEFGKFGNKYSGKVNYRGKRGTFENSSIGIYNLPRSTSDIYLEVNYKSEVPITFGIYPTSGSALDLGIPVYTSFVSKEWKKAYVRLSDDVNSSANAGKKFRIFINAVNHKDSSAILLLDNIKLIHF
ncbi:MAG: hypothetical protein ACKVQB_00080 [Bacteroidia bacterium]